MARWFNKRWVWAGLIGATVTVGIAAGRGDDVPKVGTTVSLNIDGKGERQFKVVKVEKQADGTYHSELKDTKTGETITFVDKPGDAPKGAPAGKDAGAPKAKGRTGDPLTPPMSAVPDPPKEKEPRRPIMSRIFGDRDKDKTPAPPPLAMPNTASSSNSAPKADEKKPGVFARIFGPKKPTGPSMPAATAAPGVGPVVKPSSPTPPPVLPVPPGGLAGDRPPPPVTGGPAFPPMSPNNPTGEPPRVMPSAKPPSPAASAPKPLIPFPDTKPMPAPAATPPAPPPPSTTPVPLPIPSVPSTPPPSVPAPLPTPPPPVATPMPAPLPVPPPLPVPVPAPLPVPVPAPLPVPLPAPLPIPSVPPVPPSGGGLLPIPVPPGGTSANKPIQIVVPAGYVPAAVAYDRDVQPFVIALQSMSAPSARLTAAKALSDCRHRSTDGVKGVLFQAAQMDPCGEVRAACVTHLCDLGYFNPHFLGHIQGACNDPDPMVRDAAKAACAKMIRK